MGARPTKLSNKVLSEIPSVLSHYIEANRNFWLDASPSDGSIDLLQRPGVFADLETMAIHRAELIELLGLEKARALYFRTGFEQGRRAAKRHLQMFDGSVRLALQAGPVFNQLEGSYVAETVRFEFDFSENRFYRELVMHKSTESEFHQFVKQTPDASVCWSTAGVLSGHVSEILDETVLTLEHECISQNHEACRFISRLDKEWGVEADWARHALLNENGAMHAPRHAVVQDTPVFSQTPQQETPVEQTPPSHLSAMIADAESMDKVMRGARQAARSNFPMLIAGESGTGRHTLAHAVHSESRRAHAPFEVVECGALPGALLIQELLGYEEHTVTAMATSHSGAFERAEDGTLFLNEIGEMCNEGQRLVLQLMQQGEYSPLGSQEQVEANVRVIGATKHNPADLLADGRLREDFFNALAVVRLDLSPLRERGADVLRLAQRFLDDAMDRFRCPGTTFSRECKEALMDCVWPGNVRQLKNVIDHAVVLSGGRVLEVSDLPEEVISMRTARTGRHLSEEMVRAALRRTRGNRSEAAELLGVGRTTLWRMLKRMDL